MIVKTGVKASKEDFEKLVQLEQLVDDLDYDNSFISVVVDNKQSKLLQQMAFYCKWKWRIADSDLGKNAIFTPNLEKYRLYFHFRNKIITWNIIGKEPLKHESRYTFGDVFNLFVELIRGGIK